MSKPQRIHKILARAGITSRRKAEELVTEGLVTINGRIAKVGDHAIAGEDAIKVDGKLLTQTKEAPVYIALHKPRNMITGMQDPEGRPTLTTILAKKVKARVFPVDRLPFMSDGLLILTNDGDIADQLQKSDVVPRVYQVKVKGHPDAEMMSRLEKGGKVNEEFFKPQSVKLMEEFAQKARIQVVILGTTGVDLKAFFESKGFLVEKVTRTAIGQITLHGMEPEAFRFLKKSQVEAVLNQPELGMQVIERDVEKVDAKRERAQSRNERVENEEFNERRERNKERAEKRGAKKPGYRDMFGEPGKSWEDRPVRSPRVSADYADQDEKPARMESGFKIRFPKAGGPRSAGGGYRPRAATGDEPRTPRSAGGGYRPRTATGDEPRTPRSAGGGYRPRAATGDEPRTPRSAGSGYRPRTGDDRPARGPRSDSRSAGPRSDSRSTYSERSPRGASKSGYSAERSARAQFSEERSARPARSGYSSERAPSRGPRSDSRPSGPRSDSRSAGPRSGARSGPRSDSRSAGPRSSSRGPRTPRR